MTSKHLAKFFANKYQVNDNTGTLNRQQQYSTNNLGPESGSIFQPSEFNDVIYEIYPSSFNWFGSKRSNVYLSKKKQLVQFNDVFLFNFIVKSLRKYEFNFVVNQAEDTQFIDGVKLLIDSNPTEPTQKIIKLIELIFYQCNSQIALLRNSLPRINDVELQWQIFTAKSSLIVSSCLVVLNVISKWRMGSVSSEDEIKIQEFKFLAENTIREIDIISKSETISKSFKLVQNKKQPAIIQRVIRYLKFIMIERAHQYSSFNQALFFISIFGSRIFPALFKKLSERFIEKTTTNDASIDKKTTKIKTTPITMKDAQFIGFIVGTMFGAGGCASVVNTCLDYLRDKSLGRRLENTPLHWVFLSKSIWMTFGGLIGIAINIAARQSIHMTVGKVIQSYLNNPQFIRKVAGKKNELMAKIVIRTFSNMLSKETTKMLLPTFNKNSKTPKKEQSSGFSTMTNDPFIKSLLKDQLSFVNKKNKIAGYLVDNILLGENNVLEKPQQVYRTLSNLKSKYTNALNRIIPAENSVWHYWSTMIALYLSNRFSKQVSDQSFEQQESQLYDLNTELREILNAFMQRLSNLERNSKL